MKDSELVVTVAASIEWRTPPKDEREQIGRDIVNAHVRKRAKSVEEIAKLTLALMLAQDQEDPTP